jgi:hypothetical protein
VVDPNALLWMHAPSVAVAFSKNRIHAFIASKGQAPQHYTLLLGIAEKKLCYIDLPSWPIIFETVI